LAIQDNSTQKININPLEQPEEFKIAIRNYLTPNGSSAHRAHLFTINGLTYPIHLFYGFAAVPDPHEIKPKGNKLILSTQRSKRRYSMLSYLHSIRKGDLLFFFQADPQWPNDFQNRRGFRGIWVVESSPFRDFSKVKLPSGYEILGECPYCKLPFDFGMGGMREDKKCPICGNSYGMVSVIGNAGRPEEFSKVVLSARLLISPLVIFERTSGDNRVYGDMTTRPLIWISRSDNAMGAGKGSSIRTLLPEEASKIAFMLSTEDQQRVIDPPINKYPGESREPIKDHNDVECKYPRIFKKGNTFYLEHEFHLNLYFSRNIDDQTNCIHSLLNIPLNKVDYWTTELPWGYTGDTADFVLSCWNNGCGRYKIYLFEFKRDLVDKKSLAEVLLYIPWVVQTMTAFSDETVDVEVIPVLVGKYFKLSWLPSDYKFDLKLFTTSPKKVTVRTPIALRYEVVDPFKVVDRYSGRPQFYATDLEFTQLLLPTKSISPPPKTYTTTEVEKNNVVKNFLK